MKREPQQQPTSLLLTLPVVRLLWPLHHRGPESPNRAQKKRQKRREVGRAGEQCLIFLHFVGR